MPINNNDQAPSLELDKTVTNDNGGTAAATDWTLHATGTGGSPTNLSGITPVSSDGTFKADTYTLSESGGPSGYLASVFTCTNGVVVTAGQITLANGQSTVCTINNDDIAPSSLELDKTVTNDNGGTAPDTAWTLTATGTGGSPTNLSGTTPVVSDGTFKADTYTLAESGGPSGYTASTWSCTNGVVVTSGQITLANGQSTVCTINNDDQAPSLELDKTVTNDNGGTAPDTAWTLTRRGRVVRRRTCREQHPFRVTARSRPTRHPRGVGCPSGYLASVFTCTNGVTVNGSSQITLANGQSTVCTINNDDIAPSLELDKTVTNDNGGTAAEYGVDVDGDGDGWFADELVGNNTRFQ